MLRRAIFAFALIVGAPGALAAGNGYGGPYGFGVTPSAGEIGAVDIDVMPDGQGLPPGHGGGDEGAAIYAEKCLACHGENLEGVKEAGGAPLIGGRGSLASVAPLKTVESYWPYAATLFDYIRRAMPLNAPGSLGNDEVYALTAFILAKSGIIAKDAVLDRQSLPRVRMPNRDGFTRDPRPDVFNYD